MAKQKQSSGTFVITNLLKEQRKFLFDPKYNPQFEYEEEPDSAVLSRHAYPLSEDTLHQAIHIIEKVIKTYGDEEAFKQIEGDLLSAAEVNTKIQAYLVAEEMGSRVQIQQSPRFIARTSVTVAENQGLELKIRLPLEYRKNALHSILIHELGTHGLRWVNEFTQPWYKKHREFNMRDYLPTEEGLAVLNAALHHPAPYLWLPALNYFAAYHAQSHSFAELAQLLKPYIPSPERRWRFCLRVKRGMRDTSEPGGYKKDLVYLAGAYEVAQWLRENDYNAPALYLGKVHHEDIPRLREFAAEGEPVVPKFLKSPQYRKDLDKVLRLNSFIK